MRWRDGCQAWPRIGWRRFGRGEVPDRDSRGGRTLAEPTAHIPKLRTVQHRPYRFVHVVANPAGDAARPWPAYASIPMADALHTATYPHEPTLERLTFVSRVHARSSRCMVMCRCKKSYGATVPNGPGPEDQGSLRGHGSARPLDHRRSVRQSTGDLGRIALVQSA